jgi:hypothetical protein
LVRVLSIFSHHFCISICISISSLPISRRRSPTHTPPLLLAAHPSTCLHLDAPPHPLTTGPLLTPSSPSHDMTRPPMPLARPPPAVKLVTPHGASYTIPRVQLKKAA